MGHQPVVQRQQGGKHDIENYLPICPRCNHLRWHRRGENLRELFVLGLVAKDEVKKGSVQGGEMSRKLAKRKAQNLRRRRGER